MKIIVVYESGTGFTEQYAKWISIALGGTCKPLKNISKTELEGYDRVIFGGWIMGNGIVGFEKVRNLVQPFAVFAVGSTPAYEEVVSAVKERNNLGDIPMFYMEGGFHFEKLGFIKRTILKTLKKGVSKKENRTRMEDFMAENLGTSFDHSSEQQCTPLVEYCS